MPVGKPHDPTFVAGALALAEKEGVADAAKELNIRPSLIYRWRKLAKGQLSSGRNHKPGKKTRPTKPSERVEVMVLGDPVHRSVVWACPHCGGLIGIHQHREESDV